MEKEWNMNDTDLRKEELLTVAHDYAEELQKKSNIKGVMLYNSLAFGTPNRFSDVDIVVIVDGNIPCHTAEHRMFNGTKVDVVFERNTALDRLIQGSPTGLSTSEVGSNCLKSLLLGRPGIVLFDPDNLIQRARQFLHSTTSYDLMSRSDSCKMYHKILSECITPANDLLKSGDFSQAMNKAKSALDQLQVLIRTITGTKDLQVAADEIESTTIVSIIERVKQLFIPSENAIASLTEASNDLWGFCVSSVYQPIIERLLNLGVLNPEALELIGGYRLFWPGYRLHELGRVKAEVDLVFERSRFSFSEGDLYEALGILWSCRYSTPSVERWKSMAAVLEQIGYDCSDIIEQFLSSAQLQPLLTSIEYADAEAQYQVNAAVATDAVSGVKELGDAIFAAYPMVPLLQIYFQDISLSYTSATLANSLSNLDRYYRLRQQDGLFSKICDGLHQAQDAAAHGQNLSEKHIPFHDLHKLQEWYLRQDIMPALDGMSRLPKLRNHLNWQDKKGDSSHTFTSEDIIEMQIKPGGVIDNGCMTAPMLLMEAFDDFVFETTVSGDGGVIALQDNEHYLKFHCWGKPINELRYGKTHTESGNLLFSVIGRGMLEAAAITLRLIRQGNNFSAWCSATASDWFLCGKTELASDNSLRVGIFGCNHTTDDMHSQFGPTRMWTRKPWKL